MDLENLNQTTKIKSKPKRVCNIRTRQYYNNYKKKMLNKKDATIITYKQFISVVRSLNQHLFDEIYKGYIFEIPYGLGRIGLKAVKHVYKFDENGMIDKNKSTLSVNRKATTEYWNKFPEMRLKKFIYYDNDHTDGTIYRIAWSRKGCRHTNLTYYGLHIVRQKRRLLAKIIRTNPNIELYDL